MREIAQHIADALQNALRAGARRIEVFVEADISADVLRVKITDDGEGMDSMHALCAADPFSFAGRIHLGLPLFAAGAERSGGSFRVSSSPGHGTQLTAAYGLHHPDRPPLGKIAEAISCAFFCSPEVQFVLRLLLPGRAPQTLAFAVDQKTEPGCTADMDADLKEMDMACFMRTLKHHRDRYGHSF